MIIVLFLVGDFAQIRGIDPSCNIINNRGAVLTLSSFFEQRAKWLLYHFSILTTLCLSLLLCKFTWDHRPSIDRLDTYWA